MAETLIQQVEEMISTPNRPQAYSGLLQIFRLHADDSSKMQLISLSSERLIPVLISDIQCHDEEIAALALKCLGFMLYHPLLVRIFSGKVDGLVLETLGKLVMSTRAKAVCNLGIWCICVQQLDDGVVSSQLDLLLRAFVYAIDNPFGSLSTTFEATQALAKIATRFGEKMRNASDIWAPPIYRRLVSSDRKERGMAERCLLKLKSVIYPPIPNLSKVAALDIKKNLLSNMLVMVDDCQNIVPMIRAWGWYISLIGPDSVKHRSTVNQMLKIPEQTFSSHSPPVQIASLVAWEQLIDAFIPHMTDPELNCYDPVDGLLKRITIIILPLKRIMKHKHDISVHTSCVKTWLYLLQKLDILVNHPSVTKVSFWELAESVISTELISLQSTFLWTSCLDLLNDYAQSNVRAVAPVTYNHIKWLPWEVPSLQMFLKILKLALTQCHVWNGEYKHTNTLFEYCLRITRSVLEGVKAMTTYHENVQLCTFSIIEFLTEVTESMISNVSDIYGKIHLVVAFQLVELIREEMDSSILTSTIYQVSLDLKYIKELELCKNDEDINAETLNVSPLIYKDMVSPMVYISILGLCLISETIERMLIVQLGIQHAVKHAKILLISENPLLNLQATIAFLYAHSRKSTDKKYCSLILWRIVAKSLHETVGTMYNDEKSFIMFKFLCYPFVVLLNSSEASVYRRTSCNSDMCLVSLHKEVEFELIIEAWKLLLESLSIFSKNRPMMIDNLSCELVKILDSSSCSSWNSPKIDFLMMYAEFVICILNQIQVMLEEIRSSNVISLTNSCQNNCGPFDNTFNLVSRFMKMSLIHFKINHEATYAIFCRVLTALNYLISHVFSANDVMLLAKLIIEPFADWLSFCIDLSAETQENSSIMHQSECLLNHMFDCCRRSSDSFFLGIQNSILQSSLNHPHRPICDLATKFWNEIHGKDAGSNAPGSLLLLDKSSTSGLNAESKPPFISANDCSKNEKVVALSQIQSMKRMKSKITRRPSNTKGKLECQNSDHLLNKFRRA